MKSTYLRLAAVIAAVVLVVSAGTARAQDPARSTLRANVALTNVVRVAQDPVEPIEPREDVFRGWGRNVLRIGQDYTLKQGESVHDAVVIFSPATIDGYVRGDVVVVFGTVRIGPTAVINGSLIVVGGNVAVQPGAAVNRDLVVIGGGLDAPTEFNPGGQHIAVGANAIADRLRTVVPWITEGLLLGRPIVPRLGWVWGIVFFVFLASLVVALLFMETVRACADAIAARPFSAFLTGLLVLLLIGPLSVILAASIVGIAVVPFVVCAVVVAWIIGKVGVAVRLGDRMVGQTPPASRFQSARSFAVGFAAICLIYMVPVLGFIAWALVGVTGLGAAALAFTSAYRRENPAPPRFKPAPPPPPALDPTPGDFTSAAPSPMFFAAEAPPSPALADGVRLSSSYAVAGPTANLLAFPKADFLPRAAAFALDSIFVLILCGILDLGDNSPGPFIFVLLAYHIGFWAWKGTTFGGIVCQLRVVRLDGSPLRFIDALVRGIGSLFSVAVVGLGCLWILRDEERQAWHDKIAGTYVVSVPRNWPLA